MLFHSGNLKTDEIPTDEEKGTLNRWLLHLCHEIAGYPDQKSEGWERYLNTDVSQTLKSQSPNLAAAYGIAREKVRKRAKENGRKAVHTFDTWEQLARDNPKMIGLAFQLGTEGFTEEPT